MKRPRPGGRLSIAVVLVVLVLAPPVAPGAVRQEGKDTQHLAGPAVSSPGSGDVTLLQWHRLNVGPGARKILMNWHNNRDGGHPHQILLALQADGTTLDMATIIDGVPSKIAAGVQAIEIGRWYHYAITRSGADITLYIGTETTGVSKVAALRDTRLAGQTSVWRWTAMGTSLPTYSANTSVAQFRLYNRRLSLAQIDGERCSATPVRTADLWTSNPFAAAGSYAADAGFKPWTFSEQGASEFSTVEGPSPVCGEGDKR